MRLSADIRYSPWMKQNEQSWWQDWCFQAFFQEFMSTAHSSLVLTLDPPCLCVHVGEEGPTRYNNQKNLFQVMVRGNKGGDGASQRVVMGQERRGGLLTLLFSPVQCTIAWLWVASPLSTNELLSRDICLSQDVALLKRGGLPGPTDPSSSGGGEPLPLPPPSVSNEPSWPPRRLKARLSQRVGPAGIRAGAAASRRR